MKKKKYNIKGGKNCSVAIITCKKCAFIEIAYIKKLIEKKKKNIK